MVVYSYMIQSQLYDRKISSGGSPTGNEIGQARVFSFSFDTGDRDTTDTIYQLALADVDLYTNVGS